MRWPCFASLFLLSLLTVCVGEDANDTLSAETPSAPMTSNISSSTPDPADITLGQIWDENWQRYPKQLKKVVLTFVITIIVMYWVVAMISMVLMGVLCIPSGRDETRKVARGEDGPGGKDSSKDKSQKKKKHKKGKKHDEESKKE